MHTLHVVYIETGLILILYYLIKLQKYYEMNLFIYTVYIKTALRQKTIQEL